MSSNCDNFAEVNPATFENISANMGNIAYVAESMDSIKQILEMDGLADLLDTVRNTLDFAGISVVNGSPASWNPYTKVLRVPTLKGDTGNSVTMTRVIQNPDYTVTWIFSDGTVFTTPSLRGPRGEEGIRGLKGDSIGIKSIINEGNNVYTWLFTDGTTFTTDSLSGVKGDKGATGDDGQPGEKGERGISVHHLRLTSTTEPHNVFGSFGELDTYSFYGDADEDYLLGWFSVRNGISGDEDLGSLGLMNRKTYDADGDGIVDNAAKIGGKSLEELGFVFTVQNREEILEPTSGIGIGNWVYITDDGTGQWEAVVVRELEPSLITQTIASESLIAFIGKPEELNTVASTLTSAINELIATAGNVSGLPGGATSVVDVVVDIVEDIGDITKLPPGTPSIVDAVVDIIDKVGDVSDLPAGSTSVVGAVNDLSDRVDAIDTDLSDLAGKVTANTAVIGDSTALTTTAKNLVDAINELNQSTGDALDNKVDNKVDKVAGKGLSSNDFTDDEKTKLADLESSRFKGQYLSIAALEAAVTAPEAGDYANIDEGSVAGVNRYFWDTSLVAWQKQAGASAELTAAQIKQEYESNPDTNVFSDTAKDDLAAVPTKLLLKQDKLVSGTTIKTINGGSLLGAGNIAIVTEVLQATGTATDKPMSQKAATDAFILKGEADKVTVVQTEGISTTEVMSQKATTDYVVNTIGNLGNILNAINGEIV